MSYFQILISHMSIMLGRSFLYFIFLAKHESSRYNTIINYFDGLFAFPRYIEQLVASAEAAVNEIVRRGVRFIFTALFLCK